MKKYDRSGLTVARHLRQFTKKKLSELSGVSADRISKAERGKLQLSEDEKMSLSYCLGFSVKFFEKIYPYEGELTLCGHWFIDKYKIMFDLSEKEFRERDGNVQHKH